MSDNLAKLVLKGDVHAAAQLLTMIESGDPKARAVLKKIYPRTGKAHVVGVTGAPGTGKSALIDRMTAELRRGKKKVGILTVDPTSPFSRGALLGDRLRMREHFLDPEVFIRSLASRGGLGGVPPSIRGAIHLLDAMGKEIIFIETIGVGQDEVEVSTLAHTVVVVLNPWMGDEIQGMKAGLLEIADILAVNKADLPGAEQMVQQLRGLYEDPALLILQTSATENEGITLLLDGIERHQAQLLASGDHRTRRLNFCRQELVSLLQERMFNKALKRLEKDSMEKLVQKIAERELDPYTAVERVAKRIRLNAEG
ncbi:MAG: methylmalonyl Co-A mutase-associated GTPase MeaB [Candidatus Binatia bacterium]